MTRHKHPLSGLVMVLLTTSLFLVQVCDAAEKKANFALTNPLLMKGELQKVSANVTEMVRVDWKKGKLKLRHTKDQDTIRTQFRALRSKAGSGGSSSSYGGNRYTSSFNSSYRGGMSGEIVLERSSGILGRIIGTGGWSKFQLTLQEDKKQKRLFSIATDGSGSVKVSIQSLKDNHLLRFKQDKTGRILIQQLHGDKMFVLQEGSFLELCNKHRKYVHEVLAPTLKNFGVMIPGDVYQTKVRAAVIQQLQPIDKKIGQEFNAIIKRMNSSKFRDREVATKELTKQLDRFKPLMLKAAVDESLTSEARVRVKRILSSKINEKNYATDILITTLNLNADVPYLIWLLETAKAEDEKKLIASQLQTTTKQSHNTDVAAWKKWLAKQPATNKTKSPKTIVAKSTYDPLQQTGAFQKIYHEEKDEKTKKVTKVYPMGDLLKLSVQDNRVLIDRKNWSKIFGGQTVAQKEKAVEDFIKKQGFPKDWYTKQFAGSSHVDVHFYSICKILNCWNRGSRSQFGMRKNSIRSMSNNQFTGTLEVGINKKEKPFFQVLFRELTGPRRSLNVTDDGQGTMSLMITNDPSDYMFYFKQSEAGGIIIQEFNGPETFMIKADNAKQLIKKHADVLTTKVAPLLKHFGIVPLKSK